MRALKANVVALGVLALALCMPVFSADWFVRPSRDAGYGRGDGTHYDTAWNGFEKIDWKQIKPDHTLYVCDVHAGRALMIGASGSAGHPIVIRGDWPGHPGVLRGASAVFVGGWELHDRQLNVWKRRFDTPPDYSDFHAFVKPADSPAITGLVRLHNVGESKGAGTGLKGDFARWPEGFLWPGGKGDFAAWRAWTAGVVRDAHSLLLDPQLRRPRAADFRPLPGSPAIKAGVTVGFTQDHDGTPVPRGNGVDIGAFEFVH